MGSIRLLIAARQPGFRSEVAASLSSRYPHWQIEETANLRHCVAQLDSRSVDLLIIGAELLHEDVAHHLDTLRSARFRVGIMGVVEAGNWVETLRCLAAGAHATMSRGDDPSTVLQAVRQLHRYSSRLLVRGLSAYLFPLSPHRAPDEGGEARFGGRQRRAWRPMCSERHLSGSPGRPRIARPSAGRSGLPRGGGQTGLKDA